jgi:hypothetical protein
MMPEARLSVQLMTVAQHIACIVILIEESYANRIIERNCRREEKKKGTLVHRIAYSPKFT